MSNLDYEMGYCEGLRKALKDSFSGAQKLNAYRVGEKVILGPYRERKSFRTLNDDTKPVKLD